MLTATGYVLVIVLALGERDYVAAGLVAVGVFSRTVGNVCFSLFLGLNRAAWWGMGDLTRRIATLAGVLIGFPLAGLRGACAGFAAASVLVLVIGVAGAWRYLLWSALDLRRSYLGPYLRTGTSFAAGNLLLALAQRSGETVVRLASASYMQVGFYGAAYSIYLTGAHALWQGALSFAPLLVGLLTRGDHVQVTSWLARLLKWMFVVSSLASLATLLVGHDLVPLVLGTAYLPVADCLWPLALALFALAVSSIGRLSALTLDRPGLSASAAAVELALFWGVGSLLATRFGALGMAVAALGGTIGYAAVISWSVHAELPVLAAAGADRRRPRAAMDTAGRASRLVARQRAAAGRGGRRVCGVAALAPRHHRRRDCSTSAGNAPGHGRSVAAGVTGVRRRMIRGFQDFWDSRALRNPTGRCAPVLLGFRYSRAAAWS